MSSKGCNLLHGGVLPNDNLIQGVSVCAHDFIAILRPCQVTDLWASTSINAVNAISSLVLPWLIQRDITSTTEKACGTIGRGTWRRSSIISCTRTTEDRFYLQPTRVIEDVHQPYGWINPGQGNIWISWLGVRSEKHRCGNSIMEKHSWGWGRRIHVG